jgi:hypothetical protein
MTLEPVVVTVTVPADPDVAFAVFTERIGTWWPLGGFSLGGADRIVAVEFGRAAGEWVVEIWDDGTRRRWAEVLRFDEPTALALAWNPGGWDEGRDPTRVDVTFTATDDGTEVRLVHTGWEGWGAEAEEGRAGYAEGWPVVLSGYVAATA